MENANKTLTDEGRKFLNDPVMREALTVVATSVGTSAEEYLLRFERILSENPNEIFALFSS